MSSKNKDGRKTLWLYAVILFTSAFIVLLLTAYSQIKFSRNIDEYKLKISSEMEQKNSFQLNLNSALEENKKAKAQIDSLKEELSKNKESIDKYNNELGTIQNKHSQTLTSYETLIRAEEEYEKGNIVACAELLHRQFNADVLGNAARERYKLLADRSFKKASEILFNEGYRDYRNKEYESAIRKLTLSKDITRDGYFSDDCSYYIAYSYYRQGNKALAVSALKELLQSYPGSSYSEEAGELLKELEK